MDYKVSRGCIKSLLETFQLISVPECGNMLGNGCLVLMVWGLNSGPCACKASSLSPSSFPSPCYSADKNMDEVPLVKIEGGQEETWPLFAAYWLCPQAGQVAYSPKYLTFSMKCVVFSYS